MWWTKLGTHCLYTEALVVRCKVRKCGELGPLIESVPAAGTAGFDASHGFAKHDSQV